MTKDQIITALEALYALLDSAHQTDKMIADYANSHGEPNLALRAAGRSEGFNEAYYWLGKLMERIREDSANE